MRNAAARSLQRHAQQLYRTAVALRSSVMPPRLFSRTSSSCVGVRWSTSSPGSNQIARLFRRGVGARDGAPEATWALSRLGRRGPPCCRPLMPCESSSSRPAALAPAQYFSHYARWEFVRFIHSSSATAAPVLATTPAIAAAFLQPSRLAGMAIIWTMRRIFRAAAPITNRKRRMTTCKSSGGRRRRVRRTTPARRANRSRGRVRCTNSSRRRRCLTA